MSRRPRSTPYLRRIMATGHDYVLCPHAPHSWWHELGRPKMVRRLEARGFPNLFGWLFVTLTIDPELFDGPADAFVRGRDRIRRAVARLRARYGIKRYFVKFELTEAGWPHWHLGLECRDHIDNEHLFEAWGLGFTSIKRVKKPRDFRYLFKYVTKDTHGEGVPDWVLDFPRRIRVFQTSPGFFGEPSKASKSSAETEQEKEPVTLRDRWREWLHRAVIRGRAVGLYGVPVRMHRTFTEVFLDQADKGQRPVDMLHMPVSKKTILEVIINENGNTSRSLENQQNCLCFSLESGRFETVQPRSAA